MQIAIGDGSVQRSRIENVSVEFDSQVAIESGAFVVRKRGTGGGIVDVSFTTRVNAQGRTVADLALVVPLYSADRLSMETTTSKSWARRYAMPPIVV